MGIFELLTRDSKYEVLLDIAGDAESGVWALVDKDKIPVSSEKQKNKAHRQVSHSHEIFRRSYKLNTEISTRVLKLMYCSGGRNTDVVVNPKFVVRRADSWRPRCPTVKMARGVHTYRSK